MKVSLDTIKNEFEERASKVNLDDIKQIISEPDRLGNIFKNKYLIKFLNDFRLLMSLLKDYWSGDYREIPWGALASIVAALLYVLSPIDLIPDIIPIVGFLDDAMVMSLCLSMVSSDLADYEKWKKKRDDKIEKLNDADDLTN